MWAVWNSNNLKNRCIPDGVFRNTGLESPMQHPQVDCFHQFKVRAKWVGSNIRSEY